ncbi:glycine cleavage system protein R [Acidocella aromatica]|uniref:Glycine cleavage system regulatory protein n=1 Tax=Acidocella aromatica TaxID=1303579 RepID=A0A840VBE8_9PROT|nr:ACT domain-containing protein [Acidocella aromatica]MBB5372934.1 glycine cleavage system regulatory protein [Acidocella aromatica]
MTTSLVLTFIGSDRPGLVNAISERIAAGGGSWLESRLAQLAGQFAGIVLVRVPANAASGLIAALSELQADGLSVTVTEGSEAAPPQDYEALTLEVLGHDRPGIVRDVTQTLRKLGVNIEELSSSIESAPFTGEEMFRAVIKVSVPAHVAVEEVRRSLERLADEIMVDLKEAA